MLTQKSNASKFKALIAPQALGLQDLEIQADNLGVAPSKCWPNTGGRGRVSSRSNAVAIHVATK